MVSVLWWHNSFHPGNHCITVATCGTTSGDVDSGFFLYDLSYFCTLTPFCTSVYCCVWKFFFSLLGLAARKL